MSVAQPLSIEKALWIAAVAAWIVLLWRLWSTRLFKVYRAFSAFALLSIVQSGVQFSLPRLSDAYAISYLCFLPIRAICTVWVVLELYGLVLNGYPGIGSVSRWVISGGLLISFIASVASIYPDFTGSPGQYPTLFYVGVFEQAFRSALLFFLFLITTFLLWFPVPLSRNTVLHTVVFAVYFSSSALLHLMRNILGMELVPVLNGFVLLLGLACGLAWVLFLTPRGETVTVAFALPWRRRDSDRLVRQLDAINSSLLKAARK